MATKAQYLVFTKYYKGEEKCPSKISAMKYGEALWEYERDWVNDSLSHNLVEDAMIEYIIYIGDKIPADTGYPISLFAYLFYRIGKWQYSFESYADFFCKLIKEYYLD